MDTQLFIPEKLKVGYQKREGTYTSKLAYVIYYDAKGKLRKETSWQGWRSKDIEPDDFENIPTTGFMINKGITRGGYDWYSDTVTKVRIWDPRDFEIEITLANLIAILMHSDVSKRDINVPCVYAWHGSDLVLLPTNTEEYELSAKHTAKQSLKFSSKELKIGATYNIKKDSSQVVYLGYYDHYVPVDKSGVKVKRWYSVDGLIKQGISGKKHVFYNLTDDTFNYSAPSALIATVADLEIHPQYAELLDKYYAQFESQLIGGLYLKPKNPPPSSLPNYYYYRFPTWVKVSDTVYVDIQLNVNVERPYHYHWNDPVKRNKDMRIVIDTKIKNICVYDEDTNSVKLKPEYWSAFPISFNDPQITAVVQPIFDMWRQLVQAEFEQTHDISYNHEEHYKKIEAQFQHVLGERPAFVMIDGKKCANGPTIY